MKRERGAIRSFAIAAKGRLASGFWQEARVAREASVERARSVGKSSEEVLGMFLSQIKSQVVRAAESDPAEEVFYQRVRTAMCDGGAVNPLASVLDRDYMRELTDTERERYVFTLSERVKRCIQRFEQEEEFVQLKA